MKIKKKLNDLNVVFFESRLAKTMADLIRLQGGNPLPAPSMKEVSLENNRAVLSFGEKLFLGKVDILILLTGVGTKALLATLETRYSRDEILTALKKITIIPRGPKPIRVLNELGLPYALSVPEPNTWNELLLSLDEHENDIPIKGHAVFVQEYGVSNPMLLEGLNRRGAKVTRVPVYRWELPDDLLPLKKAVSEMTSGGIQVAVFTTAVQIEHLLKVARFLGLEGKLKESMRRMVVASVGPDCTEAICARGVRVDLQPDSPKMGPLIVEIAEKAKLILEKKLSSPNVFVGDQTSMIPLPTGQAGAKSVAGMTEKVQEDLNVLEQSVFLKACRLEKTSFTPIWLMRQAGRYMQEYRKIRDHVPFLELCKNKDLVTEITVVAQEKLKADAAIIFSDILLVVESFGLGLEYLKGGGPSIKRVIRSAHDVDRLPEVNPKDSLKFVFQAIRQTRQALDPAIPLIGFAGAPFTLASYMIEGGSSKDFKETKQLMVQDAGLWKSLMEKIVRATTQYLNAQIEAGAQALQIFDSWAGHLSDGEYEKFAQPYTSKIIQGLKKGVPVIHFGTGNASFLEKFSQAGGHVIGIDHGVDLGEAWKRVGYGKAVQGNLDPRILCGDLQTLYKHTKKILESVKERPGHIFNLGHGVLPETPVENAIALVEMVHEISSK